MIVTEEQARQQWCPFARVAVYTGAAGSAINRYPDVNVESDCMCRGSACMAWRWTGHIEPSGYCGLAGKPMGEQ